MGIWEGMAGAEGRGDGGTPGLGHSVLIPMHHQILARLMPHHDDAMSNSLLLIRRTGLCRMS